MTDWASFKHGGVTFPLPLSGSGIGGSAASLLRDADPAVFYLLEFYKSVIETHVGARLIAEAVGADAEWLTQAVAETLPLNPEPYLQEEQLRFPLLAAYRKSATFAYRGQRRISIDKLEVCYVFQPLQAGEAEKLLPLLKAVVAIIDSRTELGFDPAYTPSKPTGTAGEPVWKADRAGLCDVGVDSVQYGGYQLTAEVFFPAIILSLTMTERFEAVIAELEVLDGTDATIPVADDQGNEVEVVTEIQTHPAPVLVGPISPSTGSKAGGTPVTIPCTGLIVGRSYRAIFNGSDAGNVVATSATTLQCMTPQVAAYPTLAADVYVIDQDGGLSNTLSTAFSFTTP